MAICFWGPKPFQGSAKTSQPKSRAISRVPSVLPESTTTICLAKATLFRQPGRFAASSFVMIATESGIFSAMVISRIGPFMPVAATIPQKAAGLKR